MSKYQMRYSEILAEAEIRPIPRMWLSVRNEVIDLDDLDISHSRAVFEDPQRFGLTAAQVAECADEDEELDFDLLLAIAEQRGWIRISRDISGHHAGTGAISASSVRNIHVGARWLLSQGYTLDLLGVEIDQLIGRQVHHRFTKLRDDALHLFLERGILR